MAASFWPAPRDEDQLSGLAWFSPSFRSQKRLLCGMILAVITGNPIAFALPLLFQVLICRVIAHLAWNTRVAIVWIFILLGAFDGAFTIPASA